MPTFEMHITPNPNSVKITTDADAFIDEGMEAFHTEEEAQEHPLGRHLFSVPGVADVLALPQFVTVTKHPAANWDELLPKVESALETYFEERSS